jgi:hypothetical protein
MCRRRLSFPDGIKVARYSSLIAYVKASEGILKITKRGELNPAEERYFGIEIEYQSPSHIREKNIISGLDNIVDEN